MSLLDFIRDIYHVPKEHRGHRDVRRFSATCRSRGGAKGRLPHLFPAVIVASAAVLFCAQAALADEALLRGPQKAVRATAPVKEPSDGKAGILEDIASAPVHFYQHFLSNQWGWRCAYHPSCSNYALLAIRKHGALVGSIMTFDRLQHEADEARTCPLILTGGQIKVYDPLENNDDWWYTTPQSKPASPADVK